MSLIPSFEAGVCNAWIFMIVFILQMLVVILLGKRVWERSGHPSDVKKSKLEEKSSIVGNTIWLLATVYSVFLPLQLRTTWFTIGLIIFLFGLVILVVATFNFAHAPIEKPITEGVYRFSRHPLYLSLVIIYLGTSIAAASWLFFLLAIANIFWIRIESLVEERYCLKKYGDDYKEYMNRTPRWIGLPRKTT